MSLNAMDVGDEVHGAFVAVYKGYDGELEFSPIENYMKLNCEVIGNYHDNPELWKSMNDIQDNELLL